MLLHLLSRIPKDLAALLSMIPSAAGDDFWLPRRWICTSSTTEKWYYIQQVAQLRRCISPALWPSVWALQSDIPSGTTHYLGINCPVFLLPKPSHLQWREGDWKKRQIQKHKKTVQRNFPNLGPGVRAIALHATDPNSILTYHLAPDPAKRNFYEHVFIHRLRSP